MFNLGERNLAQGRPASQSSTWGGWDASRVVDGNPDPNANHGSCSNTADSPGGPNWLMVDLGRYYTIAYVVATNRGDCCGEINGLYFGAFNYNLFDIFYGFVEQDNIRLNF